MKFSKASRPSPAVVIAAFALVFALVGTAVAGPDAISSKITKSKVKTISKKQANKAIDAAEPDLNVNSAKTADNATNAENAVTGAPRAYARVLNNTAGLGVDEARSKGITDANVTFVGGSVYCFELGFTPKNVQATIDWIAGGANTFSHATVQPYPSCPAGNDGSVRTTNNAGVGIANIDFYVTFDD